MTLSGCPASVVWDERFLAYDFGNGHPMAPVRVDLTMGLARALGLLDGPRVRTVAPAEVGEAELLRVHTADFVAAVQGCSVAGASADLRFGLGGDDNPVFPQMHEASLLVCGGSAAAADAIVSGDSLHALNLSGGLHHAMPSRASGFCVYNDIAVAIHRLLDAGYERIAYVDVDAHHGDGVQAVFWNDPRVLTVSVHETGLALFPGTGFPTETGGPNAPGSAVNVALPAGTGDQGWLRAFDAVVPPVLRAFEPQVLVSQHGCDSHALDPLTDLQLSIDGQRLSYAALHRLSHRLTEGRWLAFGGGGYSVVQVVPRAWSHLVGEVVGSPVAPETELPPSWRAAVLERTGQQAPRTMTDDRDPWARPFDVGYDPDDPLDRAVIATRTASFPLLGLPVDVPEW